MKTKKVGEVISLWRYPVKSMGGESLENCDVTTLGIPGDRGWAVRDNVTKEIRGAKKFPNLMRCQGRYNDTPKNFEVPSADIILPDDQTVSTDCPSVDQILSDFLGQSVSIMPRLPATNEQHYRRKKDLSEKELRDMLGRRDDEPLPDLNIFPKDVLEEITEFSTVRGTYFDAYPVHLLTMSWLEELKRLKPSASFEIERFRPNFVIDYSDKGLAELTWCGKNIRIGSAVFSCDIPTVRCSMTVHQTRNLKKDSEVLRTIVKETNQNVGIYASVVSEGIIEVGDSVELFI